MITGTKALKLTEIYLLVCDLYEKELQYCCERFSNNSSPRLSDQEVMTIYLFCMEEEQRFKIKHIHRFAAEYLHSWFPSLGSYAAFNNRIDRLSEAFRLLMDKIVNDARQCGGVHEEHLLDSMPITTCSGKRSGKVAPELTSKGYCSTKSMYYYGVKLHGLGVRRPQEMPYPEQLVVTPASENDLAVFKEYWSHLGSRTFYGDKIYSNKPYFKDLFDENGSRMMTPVKAVKGKPEWERKFDRASEDLFSRAVSSVRQPIESFFNWLEQKTCIQKASLVRSSQGLLVHVFGRITAAFLPLVLNS
jgi:hypothetical protein